jgi:hypothetical protein
MGGRKIDFVLSILHCKLQRLVGGASVDIVDEYNLDLLCHAISFLTGRDYLHTRGPIAPSEEAIAALSCRVRQQYC